MGRPQEVLGTAQELNDRPWFVLGGRSGCLYGALDTSNQHPRRIAMHGFCEGAHHIAAREADILEHALIELGKIFDLSASLEGLGKGDERTRELP
jgi:hypothetical protein